jgi:CRISPR-associated protein Csb2
MTACALLITVHLPDGRFHGRPEWPPSPFRLFQALVAGALAGAPRPRAEQLAPAWNWLERLDAPLIAAPLARPGCRFDLWVPNNDLDAVGGDPRRVEKIRTAKRVAPHLFAPDAVFVYLWPLPDEADGHAADVVMLAEQLYQFGRGIDMAYASAEVLAYEKAEALIAAHDGAVHRPAAQGEGGTPLRCPTIGSYGSLLRRHRAQRTRLRGGHLTQAPPTLYRVVAYDAQPTRLLFDLIEGEEEPRFARIAQTRAAGLVEAVRDRLAAILTHTLGDASLVERVVVGRGAGEAYKKQRLRILPLPSIGFSHADRAIRRVLIEVPPDCPIPVREIEWAAGSVHLGADPDGVITEPDRPQLVRAGDLDMLRHYGIGAEGRPARVWQTVTPAALPVVRRSGRLGGGARAAAEAQAAHVVRQALRHAGIGTAVEAIRLQREPLQRRGTRADAFVPPARLAARALYHVEIAFATPLAGPVVIGDGRYVGLGVMAPMPQHRRDVLIFRLAQDAAITMEDAPLLLRAVRRALMALARTPRGEVPRLFSGHESGGAPARSGGHEHVFLAADGERTIDRLVVAAPWACDRSREPRPWDRELFNRVVSSLEEVRAGRLGALRLAPVAAPDTEGDPLLGPARSWESRTSYRATRQARRRTNLAAAVTDDLTLECVRRGLPRPEVEVLDLAAGRRGGGLAARVRVRFAVPVAGPVLLGRDSHAGGGVFSAAPRPRVR